MIFPLFLIPIITLFIINFINYFYKISGVFGKIKVLGTNLSTFIKLITLLSLNINLTYSIYLWKTYPKIINQFYFFPSNSWFELQHNLNLAFIILSIFILIITILTSWYMNINIQLFLNLILSLEIFLIGSFSCINLFIFLLFFEASAIPIFLLMIYFGSDRRERLKASYYFLFFTLYGSISLLLMILNVYTIYQINFLNKIIQNNYSLWLLLFIAFAIKIPLFPLHIWLPYAHVEASTSTSILLAALMLKLGGYGLIKFMLPLFSPEIHLFFRPFILVLCIIGIIYGGLIGLRQIDLKRAIAFPSISHMNFASLGIFTFTEIGIKGAIYLMISHGLTSTALFFLVGILSERYHTRSILAYSGLLGIMPFFSFFFILISLANVGFPGTSGFIPEFLILISILHLTPLILIPVLFGMFLTTASALIIILRILFGHLKILYNYSNYLDINKIEIIILTIISFWVIFLGLYDFLNLN